MIFNSELVDASRAVRALGAELTPVMIDPETHTGTFVGSEGNRYVATLEECTCPDFAITAGSTPCKHMIRLAMELGLYPSDGMKTDHQAANAKYYSGILSAFAHNARIAELVQLYDITESALSSGTEAKADLLAFAGVPDMIESGLFIPKGKKTIKYIVDKPQKKAIEGLQRTIKSRLGEFMLRYIRYEPFMKLVSTAEEFDVETQPEQQQ